MERERRTAHNDTATTNNRLIPKFKVIITSINTEMDLTPSQCMSNELLPNYLLKYYYRYYWSNKVTWWCVLNFSLHILTATTSITANEIKLKRLNWNEERVDSKRVINIRIANNQIKNNNVQFIWTNWLTPEHQSTNPPPSTHHQEYMKWIV